MKTLKTAKLPATPQQLSLTFETEVIRHLAPPERRAVTTAVVGLLIEASGLKGERDDDER
jgi:hypothetical protein